MKEIYYQIYNIAKDKKKFIDLCYIKHQIKHNTAQRRWYEIRTVNIIKYNDQEKTKPSHLKILMIDDFKRFGYKITKEFLKYHKFTKEEINWCDDNGVLKNDKQTKKKTDSIDNKKEN